jgi:glycine/D-amino acid oxidase-like deaminating enzyme
VREVVDDVRAHIAVHQWIDALGVTVHEQAGTARFADPHTIVTEAGLQLRTDKFIICTGGMSRRLPLPGFKLTSTHSDLGVDIGPAVDAGRWRWGHGGCRSPRFSMTKLSVAPTPG